MGKCIAVLLHQIEDFFAIKIGKNKIDLTTAESERPTGGYIDRIKDLNDKNNPQ